MFKFNPPSRSILFLLFFMSLFISVEPARAIMFDIDAALTIIDNSPYPNIHPAGLLPGDTINLSIVVNTDAQATYTMNNGSLFTYTDGSTTDYMHAAITNADPASAANFQPATNYPLNDSDLTEWNYAVSHPTSYLNVIVGNGEYHYFLFFNNFDLSNLSQATVSSAQIGMMWDEDLGVNRRQLRVPTVSAAISLHNPIPEPGTMLLLGTGLIGVSAISRRRFKRS